MKSHKAFTLIELLLVIGIIAILASIVIVAIDPSRGAAENRNEKRRNDVNAILSAVQQYAVDNDSKLPEGIPVGTAKQICESSVTGGACTGSVPEGKGGVDLSVLVGTYVIDIPQDPQDSVEGTVGYTIVMDENDRVTVSAPLAEQGAQISFTK